MHDKEKLYKFQFSGESKRVKTRKYLKNYMYRIYSHGYLLSLVYRLISGNKGTLSCVTLSRSLCLPQIFEGYLTERLST